MKEFCKRTHMRLTAICIQLHAKYTLLVKAFHDKWFLKSKCIIVHVIFSRVIKCSEKNPTHLHDLWSQTDTIIKITDFKEKLEIKRNWIYSGIELSWNG